MKHYLILTFFLSCLGIDNALGSGSGPLVHVVSTFGSGCFFVMDAPDDGNSSSPKASGRCYRMTGREFKLLWEVRGFYAYPRHLMLSSDGTLLIREMEIIYNDAKPSSPFITVYKNGSLQRVLPLGLVVSKGERRPDPSNGILRAFPGSLGDSIVVMDWQDTKAHLEQRNSVESHAALAAITSKSDKYIMLDVGSKIVIINIDSGKLVFMEYKASASNGDIISPNRATSK